MKLRFSTFSLRNILCFGSNAEGRLFLPFIIFSILSMSLLVSCRDDESVFNYPNNPEEITDGNQGVTLKVTNPGGLIQQPDGTWKTNNCRVPLVGPGRVVNRVSTAFVSALTGNGNLGNIVDKDLTNETAFSGGVAEAGLLYQPIVSVKDMHHTYCGGQEVGFVYKEGTNTVLDLSLLRTMVIELYLKGKFVTREVVGDKEDVLGLNVLSLNSGNSIKERIISYVPDSKYKFDEIRFCVTGVGLEALSKGAISVKYAFVGENPEVRATSEEQFKPYWTTEGNYRAPVQNKDLTGVPFALTPIPIITPGNVCNDNPNDYATYAPGLLNLVGDVRFGVNFQKEIPAGYEIGFCYSNSDVLGLGLLGSSEPELRSYAAGVNKEDNSIERSKVGKNLLGLSLLSSQKEVKTNMFLNKPCAQMQIRFDVDLLKLGTTKFHYAYVRKPVTLDPANYFVLPDDTTYSDNYKLPGLPKEGGQLQYTVVSYPYGADGAKVEKLNGKYILMGATKVGAYRVQALYEAPNGLQVSHTATIYRRKGDIQEGCNTYITSESHGAYATEAIGWKGCLLCLFNSSNNANAVVDKDPNNYATRTGLLNLLEASPVMAIQMNKPINTERKSTRTGFVIQPNNGLLNLSALKYYHIYLYRNGQKVAETTADGNSTVGLDLLGNDNGKVRISMVTKEEFDRIELWYSGLLGLQLVKELRIYNVFYEDATCKDELVSEACLEVMTEAHHGLQIDYTNTSLPEGVQVGSAALDGLGNLLDADLESGVMATGGLVSALGGTKIGLKFNEQPANQAIGVVFGGLPDVISVGVLGGTTLSVWKDNEQVGEDIDMGLLNLDLIARSGRMYVEDAPAESYNRIVIKFGSKLAGIAENFKVTGLYTRTDSDGDGIPDCSDPDKSEGVELVSGSHACEGDVLMVRAITEAETGTKYMLDCRNQTTGRKYEHILELSMNNGDKCFYIPELPKGEYFISIYALGTGECLWNGAQATVHPSLTEWTGNVSDDWSNWDNWTEGSPWECTNVIIPSETVKYPVIEAGDRCNNIHFDDYAAAINTHLLKYNKAFVDMRIEGGVYNNLSAPLEAMVTGDMFISPGVMWGKERYFDVMNKDNYKEHRVSPIVYQRVFGGMIEKAYEMPLEGDKQTPVAVDELGWSKEFNAVAMNYEAGQGFSMRAGKEGTSGKYRFRFPKAGYSSDYASTGTDEYRYYNEQGIFVRRETFRRENTAVGKFFKTNNGIITVNLTTRNGGYFLVGNPYMAYISTADFMKRNRISEMRMYDGNTNRTLLLSDGKLLASEGDVPAVIAPMQSVLIIRAGTETTLNVTFTPSMQVQPQSTNSRSTEGGLYISARYKGYSASCMLRTSASASNGYNAREDAEMLMDSEVHPGVEIFTVADGKALNIQQMKDAKRIPLGVYLKDNSGDVTFTFSAESREWYNWSMLDTKTGRSYSMSELENGVTLAGMNTQAGRLVMVKNN